MERGEKLAAQVILVFRREMARTDGEGIVGG
jgi:hypothetical protein